MGKAISKFFEKAWVATNITVLLVFVETGITGEMILFEVRLIAVEMGGAFAVEALDNFCI